MCTGNEQRRKCSKDFDTEWSRLWWAWVRSELARALHVAYRYCVNVRLEAAYLRPPSRVIARADRVSWQLAAGWATLGQSEGETARWRLRHSLLFFIDAQPSFH